MSQSSTGRSASLRSRIVAGSAVLLSGSTLATIFSFVYNVVVARALGPEGYGQATVVYTLLTLVSALTMSFQMMSAKVVAQRDTEQARSAVYRELHQQAWVCGGLIGAALLIFRGPISSYLQLSSPVLIELLAVGAAFYVPLGTRRGFVQGAFGFRKLATNLVLEAGVRLGGSYLAVALGTGVTGVIAANAAASVISWAAIAPKLAPAHAGTLPLGDAVREMSQALVFFSGQMLINNADMVLVKHFFVPTAAGLYAAVALVGRVIYTFSSAVVNSMFPIVAGSKHEERRSLSLILTSLLLVLAIGAVIAFGLLVLPPHIWQAFFGAGFRLTGHHGLSYLLSLKALASILYALSVVFITYEMSYKIANTSWLQFAFSAAVIAGICRFHSSLEEVILVQLALMAVLLLLVGVPFFRDALRNRDTMENTTAHSLRIVRRTSEDEAISEFLKADLEHDAYRRFRDMLRPIVVRPNLSDPMENAARRHLLYCRHLALWAELPRDTQWYELEITPADLDRIRVFPRAHWRQLARGKFSVNEVAQKMRLRQEAAADPFIAKIASIGHCLEEADCPTASVLLIGVDTRRPLTIIDGNHRLLAAVLKGRTDRLRFLCGLSPSMMRCCWYRTSLSTLTRYGANLCRNAFRDPAAELTRYCQEPQSGATAQPLSVTGIDD